MLLKLDHVRIDGGTQPRVAISEAIVAEYRDAYLAGEDLPKPDVFFDGAQHWLAEGCHRVHGARAAGRDALEFEVHQGTRRDAVLFSVGANAKHGLRRSVEDKRKAVDTLLTDDEWKTWSDNAIAKACHVSVDLVSRRRRELAPPVTSGSDSEAGSEPTVATARPKPEQEPGRVERTYTTKHGSKATMNVANIGRKKAPAPAPAPAPDPDMEDSAADLLADLQRDNERMTAELKAVGANDPKAEALKWRRAFDHAQAEQSAAMKRAAEAKEREEFVMRQLRRCGRAVGEDDPSRIAARVEAFVREHREKVKA